MFKMSNTVRSTRTPTGRIFLDLRQGQMFSVNAVGSTILELLELGRDQAQIANEISGTYAVGIEIARTDVHDFLLALSEHRVLQSDDSTDSDSLARSEK